MDLDCSIGFNASTTYASPSYYAQCMFAEHLGDGTVRTSNAGVGERFFYSVSPGSADHVLHLKLVNASNVDQPMIVSLEGVAGEHAAKISSLHGATFEATNTSADPDLIHPMDASVRVSGGNWKHIVPALTIEVIDIPLH